MSDEFSYDVFISYSSRDKDWVRGELLERIEQCGLKAFIDYRDFRRGAPSIKECERGVVECRKTLIVLTPNYLSSGWTEFENIMVQTLDPANESLRLLPLLRVECQKPLRMGTLTHIDFTDDADHDLAWRQLLTALGAPPAPEPPKQPERGDWFLAHPYPMPPNFTGRVVEREMLTHWLTTAAAHPMLVVRALGGFGKSALAWHWLTHEVMPEEWPRVVWWSFYEGDASFDNFLIQTLDYLGGGEIDAKDKSGKNGVNSLLKILRQPGTVLVLDGFERALRAFGGMEAAYQGDETILESRKAVSDDNDRDCISPLAEDFLRNFTALPNIRSKVLLTTRLRPRVLEARGGGLLQGCREEELKQMQPDDAVEFFRAQGIRGTHTEIESACEPYGYHPLSLRLVAGMIVSDFQQPGDIATAKRLDVSGDLIQRQHHVLERAYNSLTPERRELLGRIACFRSPVKYDALRALAETQSSRVPSPQNLDIDLRDLVARGLLHQDTKRSRFDLHPIVRRYAYERLTVPDRQSAHARLRDYFAAVPPPDKVTGLEDLSPVIELYHHTVRAGQYQEALALFYGRIGRILYYQLGAYQLEIDLLHGVFPDNKIRPSPQEDEGAQAWAFNALGNCYSLSGQPHAAVPIFLQVINIFEKYVDLAPINLATALSNVADDQSKIGSLRAAELNLRRSIALTQDSDDHQRISQEAIGHLELGRLLVYKGSYVEAKKELATAMEVFEMMKHSQLKGVTWSYFGLLELLRTRSASPSKVDSAPMFDAADKALKLADETARSPVFVYPVLDYIRSHWLLGAANLIAGECDEAERHLHEALERCRRNNTVHIEADILIDLARLRAATSGPGEAQHLAEEALIITERSGYVLQGADAHLELAKLALARGDKDKGKEQAQKAKHLAACDGPPDYTYKAAYVEACALLKELQ
ncbi:MAG TPA: TIR domain-containing protein [Pyrinomonadaceae bacterium]|nr:TIR domain-containing protein [Pyrinomonadaceae bacterium]